MQLMSLVTPPTRSGEAMGARMQNSHLLARRRLVESQKHEAARTLSAFKKNCHKITTEEVGNVVAISA
jgi:hypothetical protein